MSDGTEEDGSFIADGIQTESGKIADRWVFRTLVGGIL